MNTSAAKVLCLITLCVCVFAPLTVLQTAAWAGMVVNYSIRAESLSQGIEETFDGAHPCALCKEVGKAQASHGPDLQAISSIAAAIASGAGLALLMTLVIRRLDSEIPSVLYPIADDCAFRDEQSV